ncbi:hypothetical protein ATO6_05375 [Oceanicola sp. 22II-s10i]|uniref:dihydrodipicolinate reductase n=1 Tax=Oceanicola sp. 22II-s10i TaxID=1317116 RepID=UPI000B527CFD|nr:dihydrodipicolinate reductase [Oceanicola sp. 22II-s10i]OWU86266.1 hypothetical protein ATO6_05375 [Oceanicola sp. 22II-s10i]
MRAVPIAAMLAVLATAGPSLAEAERRIDKRSEFINIVEGRKLTYLGVSLRVFRDGRITGRAFGREVTGSWNWQDGFFCRTLNWGDKPFDRNCQKVDAGDSGVRFTSDRGTGQTAKLSLR